MQVTVNIEAAQMGETVVEMFNSLTGEDRKELMKDIMREWFSTPINFEQVALEETLIRDIRAGKHNQDIEYYDRDKLHRLTDQEIRTKGWFIKLRGTRCIDSRAQMVNCAIDEAKTVFAAEIQNMVKTDPDIQKAKDIVLEELKKAYPTMMHDALLGYFSSFMNQLSLGINQAMAQTQSTNLIMNNIQQRMSQIGMN